MRHASLLREEPLSVALRFGLIGTGHWAAAVHAPGIAAHPQTELAGVWGRDQAKAATLAARFGAQPFSDVDELIRSVDAVAFSVPPDIQAELAVRAAEAGRPLLLEKPLALAVEAADRRTIRSVGRRGVRSEALSGTSAPTRSRCCYRPSAQSSRSLRFGDTATKCTSRCGIRRGPPAA